MIITNTRKIRTAIMAFVLLMTVTEAVAISELPGFASHTPTTQTLNVEAKGLVGESQSSEGVMESMTTRFERGSYQVITTEPWLKPEFQKIKLSDNDLISVLRQAGFSGDGLKMAWAIVQKESTGRPYAHNKNSKTGDNSYGLFQINMIGEMGPNRLKKYGLEKNEDLFTPLTNAKVAFKISNEGQSWGAWTTYRDAQSKVSQFPG